MAQLANVQVNLANKKKARAYSVTVNNWAPGDTALIKRLKNVKYMVFGEEVGEEGTPHLQGMLVFKNARTMTAIQKEWQELGISGCHLEPCRDQHALMVYCKKDGKVAIEEGQAPVGKGKRMDLDKVKSDIKDGKKMSEIAEEHWGAYCRFDRAFGKYAGMQAKKEAKQFRTVTVNWITGPTGVGKTRDAVYNADGRPKEDTYVLTGGAKWWDGYDGEKNLVIDEYAGQWKCPWLLRVLDGHILRLEIKGSFTYARYTSVTVTTNLKWHEIHPMAKEEHKNALKRRITNYVSFWPQGIDTWIPRGMDDDE